MTQTPDLEIRRWRDSDDVEQLTKLLHRAYAGQAALGFRYLASWQDAETTAHRLESGIPFVATSDGTIVGTITLYVPPNVRGCDWYDRGDVASFGQFGVEPEQRRLGIGSQLLAAVEAETRRRAVPNLALDTAEGAESLIAWYRARGFVHVGYVDWDITNYRSVVMNKPLPTSS